MVSYRLCSFYYIAMEPNSVDATRPSNYVIGTAPRVYVGHINDLNDFYLYSSWSYNKLVELAPQFTEEFSKESTTCAKSTETFHVGDYCACKINDKDWNRGVIRQLHSNGIATIFRIDYGDVQHVHLQFLRRLQFVYSEWMFQTYRLAHRCTLSNIIKPIDGWPLNVIDEFRTQLNKGVLHARFLNYNEIREISEVEISVKGSTTTVNKDFEQYQMERSAVQINDQYVYHEIPIKILDCTPSYEICMLYYTSPSRFYVYLKEELNSHTRLQIDFQESMQNLDALPSPMKYQAIAVQDSRALWHRAIILDVAFDSSNVCVYFCDIGHIERISMNNIRQLPTKFQSKAAFAIPCCLNNVSPINDHERGTWKLDDKVHDEFIKLMVNIVNCIVCSKQDRICYNVEIDDPKVGDFGTFLLNKNLVSRSTISSQNSNLTYFTSIGSSLTISTVRPDTGYYVIKQIRSAGEFYGLRQNRLRELETLSQELQQHYNSANGQSLTVPVVSENTPCVTEHYDKYHRVIVKHRENGAKVLVKLIDSGDEIVVDTSELLRISSKFCTMPAFVQTFYLFGYDESQNSPNLTRNLKKLLRNQVIHIKQQGLMSNGRYIVHVTLCDGRSVNKILLSDK